MNISVAKHVSGRRPRALGFSRKRALEVIAESDRFEDVAFRADDVVMRLHAKDEDGFSDVVALAQKQNVGCVQFAFRVFPDITDRPPRELSPKELISAVANRFGVEVQIGDRKSKCFLAETIPGLSNPTTGGRPPAHGFYFQPHFCGLNRTGGLDIWAAFCLDLKAYSEWLAAH